jgi:anti-sigma B factor antagonist
MVTIYKEDDNNLLLSLNIQEANLNNADIFKDKLVQLFDQHQKRLIISMKAVQYIDSSFLGALVAALKYVLSHKSDIILVDMHEDVANLFSLIRLDKVFKIYSSFNEAINQQ